MEFELFNRERVPCDGGCYLFEESARGRWIRHEIDALHFRDRFDDCLISLPSGSRQDVVREADVLRGVLGVPHQLLGQSMLGVEMEIAEQSLVRAELHAADDAQPVLIIARRKRMALRMVDVDLRTLVKPDGVRKSVFLV